MLYQKSPIATHPLMLLLLTSLPDFISRGPTSYSDHIPEVSHGGDLWVPFSLCRETTFVESGSWTYEQEEGGEKYCSSALWQKAGLDALVQSPTLGFLLPTCPSDVADLRAAPPPRPHIQLDLWLLQIRTKEKDVYFKSQSLMQPIFRKRNHL